MAKKKIKLLVEIDNASIDLEAYYSSAGATTVEEAVKYDINSYESGDIALEDLILGSYGDTDITVTLDSVTDADE